MKQIIIIFSVLLMHVHANSLTHMQTACDNKEATACYEFGILYEKGLGVEQDFSKAKAYYLQACDYGFDPACEHFETISAKH